MDNPSLQQIDSTRQQGSRPEVVSCFLNDRKVLFCFKKEHNLWQLPQGGIDNKETAEKALIREMTEELGSTFVDSCDQTFTLIGDGKIEFPPRTQGSKELKTDQGEKVFMRGKKYFFYAINADTQTVNLEETEFDDYQWLSYSRAMDLANQIYQRGKRRITIRALHLLKESQLIA